MNKKVTYIERQKPFWLRVIAAAFFTIAIILVVHFIITMDFSVEERHFYAHFDYFQIIFILLFFAIYFSYTINCYFDFEKKLFKREKTIGIFKYGQWESLPNLAYVSLFAVNENTFEINLWNNKNKHWDLYEKYNIKDAFTIAFELSELLNIDLLDATIPGDFKWVNKEATKKTGKMVYII
ncbi:hypothetical protein [Algibacter sp. PT7-4]|uniref:hypothetical protein n=1 Tax=Algibacter ulvanivorans TaxID=3400999 RepID=UPI003AAEE723